MLLLIENLLDEYSEMDYNIISEYFRECSHKNATHVFLAHSFYVNTLQTVPQSVSCLFMRGEEMGKKQNYIGVIISKPYQDINAQLLYGITNQAYENDYSIMVFEILDRISDPKFYIGETNLLNAIRFEMLDGIIVVPGSFATEEFRESIANHLKKKCSKPIVYIDKGRSDFTNVWNDDRSQFSEIAEHMIQKHNCRRIAFLGGPKENSVSLDRFEGFKDAMKAAGLEIYDEDIFIGDFWKDSGVETANKILERKDNIPDAVICANDVMAIYLTNTLIAGGIKVPEDIKVFGFDGSWQAQLSEPGISTYLPSYHYIGASAVCKILSLLNGENLPNSFNSKGSLLVSHSCGCQPEKHQYQAGLPYQNQYIDKLENSYLDSSQQLSLMQAENIDDFIKRLFSITYVVLNMSYFEHQKFILCLCDDWEGTQNNEEYSYRTEGYSAQMISIDKSAHNLWFFQRDFMPNEMYMSEEPTINFISPIHFNDQCFGYGILQTKGIIDKSTPQYSRFCQDIGSGLAFLNMRNQIKNLAHLSYLSDIRDTLTGVYKFSAIQRFWNEKNDTAASIGSLVFISGFSIFNLSNIQRIYGQSESDEVVISVANMLLSCCRNNEICIRSSVNEFIIIGCKKLDSKYTEILKNDIFTQLEKINKESQKQYQIILTYAEITENPHAEKDAQKEHERLRKMLESEDKNSHTRIERLYYSSMVSLRKDIYEFPDRDWTLQSCAHIMNMSISHFQRVYNNIFGITCKQDIIASRMQRATTLLIETNKTLQDIAQQCGYEYVNFMRIFKRYFNMTPTDYRNGKLL